MTKLTASVFTASVLALGLHAVPASATNLRTWVSGTGTDSGACTRTQPCLTFAFAITQTTADGEIDVLDPGGFGPVTITKSISIVNDGVGIAGVKAASGGNGITIGAGASDKITLRGLTIEGAGVGQNGITFATGKNLTVQGCVIRNFQGNGINFIPTTSSSLNMSSTIVADNSATGIAVEPNGTSLTVTAALNRVESNNNGIDGILVDGEFATGTLNATIADSVASGNSVGFAAQSSSGTAPTNLLVVRSVAENNATGIQAFGTGATLVVGQSAVSGNTSRGFNASAPGVIQSYGDNDFNNNGANSGSLGTATKQ